MILLAENRLQKSAIDDVLLADNRGPGVMTTVPLRVSAATISGNEGPGVWATETEHDSLSSEPYAVLLAGTGISIINNQGAGVRVEEGQVRANGGYTISGNAGTGLVVLDGNYTNDDDNLTRTVDGNGGGASCVVWSYNTENNLIASQSATCGNNGIDVSGNISAIKTTVKNHAGVGVKAGGNATISLSHVCNNATNFDVTGTLTETANT